MQPGQVTKAAMNPSGEERLSTLEQAVAELQEEIQILKGKLKDLLD